MATSTTNDRDPEQPAAATLEAKRPRRQFSVRKKWLFRFLAVTVIPAILLTFIELVFGFCGIGYPTSFFVSAPQASRDAGFGWITNQDFGRQFFPPGLLRQPISVAVTAPKSKDAYRIFVLGESAALGFPDPSIGFSRILDVMLQEQYPTTQFEVINTSMVAINSHVVLPIARDCARHQPDLFIVLMGNNEVVGPFGASGVINPFASNLNSIRSGLYVKSTRLGQLLQRTLSGVGRARQTPRSWKGMSMFLESHVPHSDPRLETIADHFANNLSEICQIGCDSGAAVIVCTVPVNLRDSAPFGSMHDVSLSEPELSNWQAHYQQGIQHTATGKIAEAIQAMEAAASIDPDYADLQYRLGQLHLRAKSDRQIALSYFLKALETDTLRFRSDSQIQTTIRKVAANHGADGIHLMDAAQEFAAHSIDGIPGEEWFHEHVHLNFRGNFLLARGIFEKIVEIRGESTGGSKQPVKRPLTEDECARRLAFTDWNRLKLAQQIEGLLMQPPFINQSDAGERLQRHRKQIDALRAQIKKTTLQSAVKSYESAINRWPDDWMIAMNFSQLLLELGELDAAETQCETTLKKHPYVFLANKTLAIAYGKQGRHNRAIEQYRAALRLVPDFAEAEYGLALALAADGGVEEGLRIHEARVRRDPDRSTALEQMATYLMQVGRPHEAGQRLTESLEIDPENASAHAQKGALLISEGDHSGAIHHLEEALRLRPGWPQITDLLAKLKQSSKANNTP